MHKTSIIYVVLYISIVYVCGTYKTKCVEKFYTVWRNGVIKLFNLPVCTHCNMVSLLADCLPIQIQIMKRMVRFMQSCLKCNKTSLKMLSHLAIQGSGSYMSKSCNYILSKLKLDAITLCSMK